ncbi:DUF3027 domain-containing protein [uncultured Bifidobacterium sp.]|uniref:DUF3027 domain-containing protein n=1 Tax=uncultured Bifidobacterium sp. TaxID=165187 RepID=UPI002603A900|nr:DUF3027 domain-containing protein [uncultured Bifidobacterium sp.]
MTTQETAMDPRDIALSAVVAAAEDPGRVGGLLAVLQLDDGVTDYRFACLMTGYEGWQWSATLFHDTERELWTVDESSLVPTDDAVLSPSWVPWKDRLEPSDISVTDVMGTSTDDARLESGLPRNAELSRDGEKADSTQEDLSSGDGSENESEDRDEVVEEFSLTRNRVLSPEGRSQTAERWYHGSRGPRSLSTRVASGNPCSTCGFLVPIRGDLGLQFGVCANMWSPDDGKVVSLDHGCGEHSQIQPPASPHLWVQSTPAYDDIHIDVIEQRPREESAQIELIESAEDGDGPVDGGGSAVVDDPAAD